MRRLIVILMLLIVPLQLGYAAAAAYCQHESGSAAGHFGHHAHEHHERSTDAKDVGKGKVSMQVDQDCGFCHLQMPQLPTQPLPWASLPTERLFGLPPGIAYTSVEHSLIERPNWAGSL